MPVEVIHSKPLSFPSNQEGARAWPIDRLSSSTHENQEKVGLPQGCGKALGTRLWRVLPEEKAQAVGARRKRSRGSAQCSPEETPGNCIRRRWWRDQAAGQEEGSGIRLFGGRWRDQAEPVISLPKKAQENVLTMPSRVSERVRRSSGQVRIWPLVSGHRRRMSAALAS